jgi:outer membrane protein assembly factor BamC
MSSFFIMFHQFYGQLQTLWTQCYRTLILISCSLSLLACNSSSLKLDDYLPDQRLDYKRQREATENLELPPNLTSATFDDALDIPPPAGVATYSGYIHNKTQNQQEGSPTNTSVLPNRDGIELVRSGERRWLVTTIPPTRIWERLIAFWRQQGILLVEQNPAIGVMKTDWIENRAEIRNDIVTRMIRKVVDGLYSTSTRDQYQLRIDKGVRAGTTEIYLTHRAMEERLLRNTLGEDMRSVWEPAPSDPEKEAIMLRRLMLFLGASQAPVEQLASKQLTASSTMPGVRRLADGSGFSLAASSSHAWQQIALALDRAGFAVVDRNRDAGFFEIRYENSDAEIANRSGLLGKLAFWKKRETADTALATYQVQLEAITPTETTVRVRSQSESEAAKDATHRILNLISEQL